ncbi:MAG: site-specific integrase [Aerococcaceae bacterium]|nr:site-specific integrase [Aerococcaceae bacterium]
MQLFLDALHKDTKTMWYVFFRVLAFTGMRKGEALALTWRDINLTDKSITINKTVSRNTKGQLIITTPKTRNSNRIIQIDDNTLRSLQQWRTEQARYLIGLGYRAMQGEQLIFANLTNNSIINTVYPTLLLKRVCQKHQLKEIKVHGFRHTHCSLLFEAGVPMKDVKERLGHADIKTTMNIYTHVTQNSKEQSAQLFANYVNF